MTSTQPSTVLVPAGVGPVVAVPWSGGTAAGPRDCAAAVDRLPGSGEHDPFARLLAAFLIGYPRHSARADYTDLTAWSAWCAGAGVHPFDARRHHVDAWVRALSGTPRTGRPLAAASIAHRLSAVSAFYDYGIGVDVLAFSPVANVGRPRVGEDSATVGRSVGRRARRPAGGGGGPLAPVRRVGVAAVCLDAAPRKDERSRAFCLERLLRVLPELGVDHLLLERREPALNARDLALVQNLRRARIGSGIRVEHADPCWEELL